MKKSIFLIMLLLVVGSSAKSQTGPDPYCTHCTSETRDQRDTVARRAERQRESAEHNAFPGRINPNAMVALRYATINAKFAITNDSDKKIKAVTWECALISLDQKKTVASYTLVTRKSIAPHKSATLSENLVVPRAGFSGHRVAPANQTTQKLVDSSLIKAEQVNRIIEITYADGSVIRP